MPDALHVLVLTVAGWVNRPPEDQIAYLREEQRGLRAPGLEARSGSARARGWPRPAAGDALGPATGRIVYNPATMTEDEREHLLSTVGQAHASLSEAALKLRLGLPPNTPARKTAMKAERAAFELKRALQRLDVKDGATITRREPSLPEVRRGGKGR